MVFCTSDLDCIGNHRCYSMLVVSPSVSLREAVISSNNVDQEKVNVLVNMYGLSRDTLCSCDLYYGYSGDECLDFSSLSHLWIAVYTFVMMFSLFSLYLSCINIAFVFNTGTLSCQSKPTTKRSNAAARQSDNPSSSSLSCFCKCCIKQENKQQQEEYEEEDDIAAAAVTTGRPTLRQSNQPRLNQYSSSPMPIKGTTLLIASSSSSGSNRNFMLDNYDENNNTRSRRNITTENQRMESTMTDIGDDRSRFNLNDDDTYTCDKNMEATLSGVIVGNNNPNSIGNDNSNSHSNSNSNNFMNIILQHRGPLDVKDKSPLMHGSSRTIRYHNSNHQSRERANDSKSDDRSRSPESNKANDDDINSHQTLSDARDCNNRQKAKPISPIPISTPTTISIPPRQRTESLVNQEISQYQSTGPSTDIAFADSNPPPSSNLLQARSSSLYNNNSNINPRDPSNGTAKHSGGKFEIGNAFYNRKRSSLVRWRSTSSFSHSPIIDNPTLHTMVFVFLASVCLIAYSIATLTSLSIGRSQYSTKYDSRENMTINDWPNEYDKIVRTFGALSVLFASCSLMMIFNIWTKILRFQLENSVLKKKRLNKFERFIQIVVLLANLFCLPLTIIGNTSSALLLFMPMSLGLTIGYAIVHQTAAFTYIKMQRLPEEPFVLGLRKSLLEIQVVALRLAIALFLVLVTIVSYAALTVNGWRWISYPPLPIIHVMWFTLWLSVAIAILLVTIYAKRNLEKFKYSNMQTLFCNARSLCKNRNANRSGDRFGSGANPTPLPKETRQENDIKTLTIS